MLHSPRHGLGMHGRSQHNTARESFTVILKLSIYMSHICASVHICAEHFVESQFLSLRAFE